MYPTFDSYLTAIAECVVDEFTAFADSDAEQLVTRMRENKSRMRIAKYAYDKKYLPTIVAEVLVNGGSVDQEAFRCTDPYFV